MPKVFDLSFSWVLGEIGKWKEGSPVLAEQLWGEEVVRTVLL